MIDPQPDLSLSAAAGAGALASVTPVLAAAKADLIRLLALLGVFIVLGVTGTISGILHLYTTIFPDRVPRRAVTYNLVISLAVCGALAGLAFLLHEGSPRDPNKPCLVAAGVVLAVSALGAARAFLIRARRVKPG